MNNPYVNHREASLAPIMSHDHVRAAPGTVLALALQKAWRSGSAGFVAGTVQACRQRVDVANRGGLWFCLSRKNLDVPSACN